MDKNKEPNIVVMGGGTGSFTVLSGLKKHPVCLKAIVVMSDDGGSTGRLRDELGVLPPGDVRQCLVALSESSQLMRDLFNWRFEDGNLRGHNFGNLFISALEKSCGSFDKALEEVGQVLSIKGEVIPVILENVKLVAELESGQIIYGEDEIDHSKKISKDPIKRLFLQPEAEANPRALAAIRQADVVVIGPGSIYGSILPLFLAEGITETLQKAKARVIYNVNLMTRFGHTDGFDVFDFVSKVEEHAGKEVIDDVIFNNKSLSPTLVKKYAVEGRPVSPPQRKELKKNGKRFWGQSLIPDEIKATQKEADQIKRTLIRHDVDKLAETILSVAQ